MNPGPTTLGLSRCSRSRRDEVRFRADLGLRGLGLRVLDLGLRGLGLRVLALGVAGVRGLGFGV